MDGFEPVRPATAEQLDAVARSCTLGSETLGDRGANYVGCQSVTRSGRGCMWWSSNYPHRHGHSATDYPELGDHNFCRNPGGRKEGIWCYTLDPNVRWEYCDAIRCGNGVVELLEDCDDGNASTGDGCAADCSIEPGFVCLLNTTDPVSRSFCKQCRNGVVEGAEECDDGNPDKFDGCSPYCEVEPGWRCRTCGAGESCPSGSRAGLSLCWPAECGNGRVDAGERCDDGNVDFGDGCTTCEVDAGFVCSGAPSRCVPRKDPPPEPSSSLLPFTTVMLIAMFAIGALLAWRIALRRRSSPVGLRAAGDSPASLVQGSRASPEVFGTPVVTLEKVEIAMASVIPRGHQKFMTLPEERQT